MKGELAIIEMAVLSVVISGNTRKLFSTTTEQKERQKKNVGQLCFYREYFFREGKMNKDLFAVGNGYIEFVNLFRSN